MHESLNSGYGLIDVNSAGEMFLHMGRGVSLTPEETNAQLFLKYGHEVSFSDIQAALAEGKNYVGDLSILQGANLIENEYAPLIPQYADLFFFITGFHGFHVFSGVVFNLIILINVVRGVYDKRGHYEMVEKVGLYWHFVDLVWVFVFTFFYLV
jgi:hypothetical protein